MMSCSVVWCDMMQVWRVSVPVAPQRTVSRIPAPAPPVPSRPDPTHTLLLDDSDDDDEAPDEFNATWTGSH